MDMQTTPASPANEAWRNSPRTRKKKHRAMKTRENLLALFPIAFMPFYAPKIPLKIGIHEDILYASPALNPKRVGSALEDYCGGRSYLRAMLVGAMRIDLDGNPAGIVTDEQAKHAAERLKLLEVLP